ncbi:MAG: DUF763 domain-containing protein [Candidatus Micrarchaeia archaeon]
MYNWPIRSGSANLPLHTGRAPKWLFRRMVRLGGLIAEFIIDEYGTAEFLRRLGNPFFFQALGCALGFDWHSSGLTTTTCGALKEYMEHNDMGVYAAGGKGATARNAPAEIHSRNIRHADELVHASRIIAKVDSAVVQDGYQLYHHCMFFDCAGRYAVVQQGLNDANGYARRYHWTSESVAAHGFTDGPHTGIAGAFERDVLDLSAPENRDVRKASLDIVKDNPRHIYRYFKGQASICEYLEEDTLTLKRDHYIRGIDLSESDRRVLEMAYELQPRSYEELIMLEGMGPKKIRALALVADLVYGTKITWRDPVKYSFAHGGKDGIPFPVQRADYDNTIRVLEDALSAGGAGSEMRRALKTLREKVVLAVPKPLQRYALLHTARSK